MTDADRPTDATTALDIGDYCRRVEDHLTRANAGHLVRIVGPGFELVRTWAAAGVPLSVVFRAIDLKADRHREGRARRPLRIEFCEGDVRAVFDHWRRAVGLSTRVIAPGGDGKAGADGEAETAASGELAEPKRRSLSRHLDRAIDRLSRAGGRLDFSDGLRGECDRVLQALSALRESSAKARGAARDEAAVQLAALDADLAAAARAHAPAGWLETLRTEAAADLAPFRTRLAGDAWQRSMDVTIDRLLRDRFGLPQLEL